MRKNFLHLLFLLLLPCLSVLYSCDTGTSNEYDIDTMPADSIEKEVAPVQEIVRQPEIRMRADFNPTVQISKKVEALTLKELFFKEFKAHAFKTMVHPDIVQRLKRQGALEDGIINTAISGPLSIVDLEYIQGKSCTENSVTYLSELTKMASSSSNCKSIPMDSKLAKAYFLQDIRGFCSDNKELVTKWCKEIDKENHQKEKKRIEENQKKYL